MPAKSEKQRKMMAIAEHHPEALNKENRGVLKMSHEQLHDFASTKGKDGNQGRHLHETEHHKRMGYKS